MTLGEKIASARKEKGMTQEMLAEQLGVTRQAVARWETGLSPAQYRKAERAGEQPSDPQEEDACTPNIDKNRNS